MRATTPTRAVELLADEDQAPELDADELRRLVDQRAPDRLGAVRADERRRELRHGGELAVELARPRLGLAHPVLAADEPVSRDAREEQQRRQERQDEQRQTTSRDDRRTASPARRR